MKSTKNPHDASQEYADKLKNKVVNVIKNQKDEEAKQQQYENIFKSLVDQIDSVFKNADLGIILSLEVKKITYTLKSDSAYQSKFKTEVKVEIDAATIKSNGVELTFAPEENNPLESDGTIQFNVYGKEAAHMKIGNTYASGGARVKSSLGETYNLIHQKNKGWELVIMPDAIQQQAHAQAPLTEAGILRIIYGIFKSDLDL